MAINENVFENLNFNPFSVESILLNNNQDPDENLSEIFKNCSYFTPDELKVLLKQYPEGNKSLSIICFNIRSMKKNFEEFKAFFTELNDEFSIISLTETWCLDDPRNESLFKLNNYTSMHQPRSGGRNGGGTCMFVHNSLTFTTRSDLCVNNNDIESLSIEIFNKKAKNIIASVTYRQPAGNINVFENSLKTLLSFKKDSSKQIHLTGDFNLNLLDYKTNAKVKSYLDLIFSHSFIPLINRPTRISKHNATIIDHILTNAFINKTYLTGVLKTDISDHFPVVLITESDFEKNEKSSFVFKRKITDINLTRFKESLLDGDWCNGMKHNDPDTAYNEFLNIFIVHYDTFFPKKMIKIKFKNLTSPWITKGIVKSSKRKQKLYEKFLKQRTPRSEENYKNYKRLFETIKTRSKSNYFNERLDMYKNNVKKNLGCNKRSHW